MSKELRKVVFADNLGNLMYDTDFHGPWTLSEQTLSVPERKTSIIDIPGRDGTIDLAQVISNGEPRYKQRDLSLRFECSVGCRDERSALIYELINRINGRYCHITLPDKPLHYLEGYIDVLPEYNDENHASVRVNASVAPYFVSKNWIHYDIEATGTMESVILHNRGGKRVIPQISAYAIAPNMPNIMIRSSALTTTLADYSTHMFEELAMDYDQAHIIRYMGSGHLVITWREAFL